MKVPNAADAGAKSTNAVAWHLALCYVEREALVPATPLCHLANAAARSCAAWQRILWYVSSFP